MTEELSLLPDIVDIQRALLLVSEVSSLGASRPGPEVHLMLKHVTLEEYKRENDNLDVS